MSGANPLSQLGPFWRDREFWRDVGRNTQQVAGGLTAGALGAPVDIASAVVRPFAQLSGYSMPPESVVGSSDWFGKKMGHDTGSIPWMAGSIGPVPDGVDAARLAGSLDKLGPLAAIGMSRLLSKNTMKVNIRPVGADDAAVFGVKPGVKKVDVLVNPESQRDISRWAGRDVKSARFSKDADGNVYVWDAGEATHHQVEAALGVKVSPLGRNSDNPAPVDEVLARVMQSE